MLRVGNKKYPDLRSRKRGREGRAVWAENEADGKEILHDTV